MVMCFGIHLNDLNSVYHLSSILCSLCADLHSGITLPHPLYIHIMIYGTITSLILKETLIWVNLSSLYFSEAIKIFITTKMSVSLFFRASFTLMIFLLFLDFQQA